VESLIAPNSGLSKNIRDENVNANGKRAIMNSTVRIAILVLSSLTAWLMEIFLVVVLWSARTSVRVPMYFYILPLVHLTPWAVAIQWLYRSRRAFRKGVVDAAGAAVCYDVITNMLLAVYICLTAVESMLGLAWRSGTNIFF
jgi:hypothetical protein